MTLWTYFQLEDDARIGRFVSRADQLNLASLMAMAYHAPKELGRVRRELSVEVRGENPSVRSNEHRLLAKLRARPRSVTSDRPHADA